MRNLIFEDFKKNIQIRVSYLCTVVGAFFLTGCSQVDTSSDLYQSIQQQTQQFTADASDRKVYSAAYIIEKTYEFCTICQAWAPLVSAVSILIGALILHLVSEDQAIRRKAWAIFIIGIPVLMGIFGGLLPWFVGEYL